MLAHRFQSKNYSANLADLADAVFLDAKELEL